MPINRWMHCLLYVVGHLCCVPAVVYAQQGESLPSFRVLNPAPTEGTPVSAKPSAPAVWLDGTIEEMSRTPVEEAEDSVPLLSENYEMGVTPIPTHSSFDTTSLTNYNDSTAVMNQTMDNIYQESHPAPLPPRADDPDCAEVLLDLPKPLLQWKSTSVAATWLPGSGDDFGMTDLSLRGTIKSPRIPFLSITPSYQVNFLDGPDSTDVPGTLHRASVSFMGMMPFSERWIGQVMVNPGVASDFENTSSESLRIVGMGMMIFIQSPQLQWVFGVIYLDRDDVPMLPAVGLTWTPDERNRFEFSFPRPRYMRQLSKEGEREQWWYLAAELGGGSWAVERASGVNDVLTLRDYRLLTGMEYKLPADRSWYWEAGLVIGREVEYESGIGDYRQDPTLMLRCGMTF